MAGGLVGLFDDVAALAKLAAASIDDVGAAAGRASMKAAGLVVDDTAVTPTYVHGLAAERELPIIKRIATGSIKNKLLFILPAALLLSEIAPTLVEIILIFGGTYLCYEGAHKILHAVCRDDHDHDLPAAVKGPNAEEETVSGAIRTDFILSAEIMVISLKEVIDETLVFRAISLVIVAIGITIAVYGFVTLIVKMDDVGLAMTEGDSEHGQRVGRALVTGTPKFLTVLTVVGTGAMLWVGGHILFVSADELGWHWPYTVVHDAEEAVHGSSWFSGVLEWLVNTGISAVFGLAWGLLVVGVVSKLPIGNKDDAHAAAH
ncbi:MAG: DUF808 domain-containing protein [Acidimicrobiales bacterium]|jgi:hypothetical protein|nr:DUF808 domain-containing protein [Acidimicrobiales bacterium]